MLDEQGRHIAQIAAQHHDMGKWQAAFQKAAENIDEGLVFQVAPGTGQALSSFAGTMTLFNARALSAGFQRAIWLVNASQAELLVLGNRTIARLEEDSVRRQLKLDALVGDPEILDATLRLEWLLMQHELKVNQS